MSLRRTTTAACLGLLAATTVGCKPAPFERDVRTTVVDVLFEDALWRVTVAPPRMRVRVTSLTPSFDTDLDGADRRTLSMPPPCAVELDVPAELEGPLELHGYTGLGVRFRTASACRVTFAVDVAGTPVWSTTIDASAERPDREREWRALGSEGRGIAVAPGDRVAFRTTIDQDAGTPPLDAETYKQLVRCGFADLKLVRTERKVALRASPATPSVVLIVMDTLRADRLSCYGADAGTTPHLDALAARGVRFENAYATSSWTWPSTASILTGLSWDEHGVLDEKACLLSPEIESVAEALQDRDFVTAAFACNPLVSSRWRFDQGFETFETSLDFRYGGSVVPDVLAWLDAHAGTRFFLYLHMVDTHGPYGSTPESLARVGPMPEGYPPRAGIRISEEKLLQNRVHRPNGEPDPDAVLPPEHQAWLRAEYLAAVMSADHYVGLVLERLRALGMEDDTVVVFTSDHGEGLLDHGYAKHGHQLYEELVRVPLILAGPGVPRGERVEELVSNRHVAPTIARLGGAELGAVADALDLLERPRDEARSVTFATRHGLWNGHGRMPVHGIRRGPWTLHHAAQGRPWEAGTDEPPTFGAWTGEVRLFDLEQDPEQRVDRSRAEPALVEELLTELDAARDRAEAHRPEVRAGAGRGTLKLLRGIGYIEGGEDDDEDEE